MTRILLALLALLGFAAQAAPAEAGFRDGGRAQVGAVQATAVQARIASAAIKSCAPPVMQREESSRSCLPIALAEPQFRAWTVLQGIDRARE